MTMYDLRGTAPYDIRRVTSRAAATSPVPITIVSADSHAMLPPEDYLGYLDPKYRDQAADYLAFIDTWSQVFSLAGYPLSTSMLDAIDKRTAMRSGGELGSFDPARRLRETEAEGVVAELLHPDGPLSLTPFFSPSYAVCSPELRAAGARAHNRFLSEFCSAAPQRLLAVALIYPWPDMSAAVKACRDAAEQGARAIYPPQQAGVPGDPCKPFYDRSYDPLWEVCQELGLVVHIHAGCGQEQGGVLKRLTAAGKAAAAKRSSATAEALDTFVERRPLWQFMWGGVFDRFPRLRVAFMEVHCDWVPFTLNYLERYARDHSVPMRMTPTEYWQRHCAVGMSVMRAGDAAVRHEIGIDKFMFGTDYPHIESTWPNTLDFIRTSLGGFPEGEVRQILGENAIEFYGLDRAALAETAMRCGPLPAEILGEHHHVDQGIVDSFHTRSGYLKPANFHETKLRESVEEDVLQIFGAKR